MRMYFVNLFHLWVTRKISFLTLRMACVERPIAVAGRGGSYVVDPDFDQDPTS